MGDEVFERLVAPLVGGINVGDADRLSVRAVTPQSAAARDAGPSLVAALREQRRRGDAPVFLAPRGGMGVLVDRRPPPCGTWRRSRRASAVDRLDRTATGWQLDGVDYDAAVLTPPAPTAAALIRPFAPAAAEVLAAIERASVFVLVALAVPRYRCRPVVRRERVPRPPVSRASS